MANFIFQDIKELIFEGNYRLINEDDGISDVIKSYLDSPNEDNAKAIFKYNGIIYNKRMVFDLTEVMTKFEKNYGELVHIINTNAQQTHREHYIHSANVFVLGLGIYSNCKKIRDSFSSQKIFGKTEKTRNESFLFRWALASCLHDISYPLNLLFNLFNDYLSSCFSLENNKSLIKVSKDFYDKLKPIPTLSNSTRIKDSKKTDIFTLIIFHMTNLAYINYPIRESDLEDKIYKYIRNCTFQGRIDHGIMSAFIMLKSIYNIYYENPNYLRKNFYQDVVDAATAIFLHTSYLKAGIINLYSKEKYNLRSPSPLGYLLGLCDAFSEWNREDENNENLFSIKDITDLKIELEVSSTYERKIKMEKECMLYDGDVKVKVF